MFSFRCRRSRRPSLAALVLVTHRARLPGSLTPGWMAFRLHRRTAAGAASAQPHHGSRPMRRGAVRPSASASATAAGPIRSSACGRDPLDDDTRTKSAALRPPRAARGAAGRQHVIRPGDVVAARLRAQRADEHGAGPRQPRGDGVVVADDVLGRQPLAERDRLVQAARDDDAAVALRARPRPARSAGICADDLGLRPSRASARDGVNRIARASGSCSACAIRSAAIQSARRSTTRPRSRSARRRSRSRSRPRPAPSPRRRRRCPGRRSCRRAGSMSVP